MHGIVSRCLAVLALAAACLAAWPAAAQTEKRIALVIGNGAYPQGALATAANDAGLIAQTLQAAGFDVVGARDLDGDTLRHALHDFVQKAAASGPDTVAMVYLAGYGLQVSGENYFLPVDANITRDSDLAVEGVRIGDYIHQLAALRLRVGIVVADAAHAYPVQLAGEPLAGGLAMVEPDPNMLVAFDAAPDTVGPNEPGPYGAYAQALAEMIRAGGMSLPDLFDRVRLRVNELTKGALVPWNAQRIQTDFVFFERAPDAPQAAPPDQVAQAQTRQIRDFPPPEAYAAAVGRDTLEGYEEFLGAYPTDPMAARVRVMVAARREAITWRRTFRADTPNAYWSYLRRYPRGPHAWDARRRLEALAAALEPPPAFAAFDYDVPPPPPDEIDYIDRPVLAFDDPGYGFAPPPPPPVYFLPPPEPEFVVLSPPPPPVGVFVLPVPLFVAVPTYVVAPRYVAPPPNNIIFANIHNTTVINTVINRPAPSSAGAFNRPGAAGAAAATVTPALPPSVQHKAALIQQQGPPGTTRPNGPGPNPQANLPASQMKPLPGLGGAPLPHAPLTTTTTRPNGPPTTLSTRPTNTPSNVHPTAPLTNVAPNTATQGPPPHRRPATAALPPNPHVTPSTSTIHTPGPAAVTPSRPPNTQRLVNRPPPHAAPAIVNHAPPAVTNRAPPPPPPPAHRAPPPAAMATHAPPPPPPPPHPAVRTPPPPPHPAAAAAKKCAVVNGKQVCR